MVPCTTREALRLRPNSQFNGLRSTYLIDTSSWVSLVDRIVVPIEVRNIRREKLVGPVPDDSTFIN